MNLQEIMAEADVLVANSIDVPTKIKFLNEINAAFFEVVKIPRVHFFNALAGIPTISTAGQGITMRNIDRVLIGTALYRSYQLEDVPPGHYGWSFDETSEVFTLEPAPIANAKGYVRFMQSAKETFTATNPQNQTPEAPAVYHEIYVLGLCERISKSMDDAAKANNYGNDYRGKLLIAQQNYVKAAAQ